jgi:penicillin-insensitive murein endopeptidase
MIKLLITFLFSISCYSSESIGYYSKGRIQDSVSIDNYTSHFEKLFRDRNQLFGTDHLLDFVSKLALEIKSDFPDVEKLQIGDISAQNGGKIYRHQSHQNGLDIDIVYLRVNKQGQSTTNPEWGEYFTKGDRLTENFDVDRNWKLFKNIVSKGGVGRIFVDLAVKSKYCELYSDSNDELTKQTLRRLRPAKYHKTHLHLRLECPSKYSRCRKQSPPANNTGCNSLRIEEL